MSVLVSGDGRVMRRGDEVEHRHSGHSAAFVAAAGGWPRGKVYASSRGRAVIAMFGWPEGYYARASECFHVDAAAKVWTTRSAS